MKFRDRLLDIVERHHEGKISVGAMMDLFDEVIVDVETSMFAAVRASVSEPIGVAAPPAQDAE